MRNRGGIIGDASEFDDREEKTLRRRIVRRNILLGIFGLLALATVVVFVVVPAVTGKTAQQLLRIGKVDDPHVVELIDVARASLWPDTDTSTAMPLKRPVKHWISIRRIRLRAPSMVLPRCSEASTCGPRPKIWSRRAKSCSHHRCSRPLQRS